MADKKSFTRREFIDRTAKGAAGLAGYSLVSDALAKAAAQSMDKSTVVVVKNDAASKIEDENNQTYYRVDQEVVQGMMDAGIRRLTGIEDIGEAWKSLFPGITPDKVISIKVNTLFAVATHPEVTECVTNGLLNMKIDGRSFPAENIILWDNTNGALHRAGYTLNRGDPGIQCFGTCNNGIGNSSTQFDVAGVSYIRLSKILMDMSDYLINVPILKHHNTAGVTLSLKNHYGTCTNPSALHGGGCNPYIPALNALPEIKDKQVICICDAIYGIISGGTSSPTPQVIPNSLILSKDPVAHDYIGTQVLRYHGMRRGPNIPHIETAAKEPYNLGTADPEKIELIEIETTGVEGKRNEQQHPKDFQISQNYPNPFNAQTTISYQLFQPANVKLNVYNIQGRLVRTLVDEYQSRGNYRISWDGMASNGLPASSGTYLGQFQIDTIRHTIRMHLVK